jgi:hypothetical protein
VVRLVALVVGAVVPGVPALLGKPDQRPGSATCWSLATCRRSIHADRETARTGGWPSRPNRGWGAPGSDRRRSTGPGPAGHPHRMRSPQATPQRPCLTRSA